MPDAADPSRTAPATPKSPVITPPTVVHHGRVRRALGCLAVVAVALVILGEIVCRVVGLGDPPLYVTDPQIGYLMKPGVSHPLWQTVTINQWGMRGPDLPAHKSSADELRVLVIGDSIVYAGAVLDDAEVATALLEPVLAGVYGRPGGAGVRVANISCGSWGPGNQLAFLKQKGTFDADAAVIVFNSLDYGSVVRHLPLNWAQPMRKPLIALEEGLQRSILRFAPFLAPNLDNSIDEYNPTPADAAGSLSALREMVELLRSKGIAVAAIQHPRLSELNGTMLAGHAKIAAVLAELKVPTIQSGPALKAAIGRGLEPYRDDIHLSPAGQVVLRDLLVDSVRSVLPPTNGR